MLLSKDNNHPSVMMDDEKIKSNQSYPFNYHADDGLTTETSKN